MAQTLELLAHRTETLRSIRGIVRTMKTMSAINALPYEQAARAIDAYRDVVLDGFQAFVLRNGPLDLAPQDIAVEVTVAFGSDHGLCGNYNEAVADEVARHPAGRVLCVGAQLQDALIGTGRTPEAVLLPPASADGLGRLAGALVTRLEEVRQTVPGNAVAVTLVYTERREHGLQQPTALRLLPLDLDLIDAVARRPWPARSLPHFTLQPSLMLAALVREFLFVNLFRAAAEALVTENAARLARMQQAEQSVDERLEDLASEIRAVRQSEITTELLDIIVGFEALKTGKRSRSPVGEDG